MYDIYKRFEERYGFLKKMGIKFEGIQMIDPIKKKQAIVLTRPFLFDCRLLPKKYDGIEIKIRIQGGLPEEFKVTSPNDHSFAPEKFENYVTNHIDELRTHFEKPEATREELLDMLAFGNFEEHKRNFQNMLKEKQRQARLLQRKTSVK
ncbi:MAG: hypothetical protein KatS3mg027_2603 [Bacteroidia bacterium]|nr:MAG: hypothetical protein KatS3mg027_2603 [Bacteroidia bacterium]